MPVTTGSRSFDFANIAAEGVIGVEVHKTSDATNATGGIGSTINVLTTPQQVKATLHQNFLGFILILLMTIVLVLLFPLVIKNVNQVTNKRMLAQVGVVSLVPLIMTGVLAQLNGVAYHKITK